MNFGSDCPLRPANIDHADAGQIGALTVALVDDVATDRRIIGGMCRMLGWRVIELSSGQSLLDLCAQLAQTGQTLPDALLVDWKMPEMDGIQTLDKLTSKLALTMCLRYSSSLPMIGRK